MPEKDAIFEGITVEKAIENGLKILGAAEAEVEITVIEKGNPGYMGLFSTPAKVSIKLKNTAPKQFVRSTLPGTDSYYRLTIADNNLFIITYPHSGHGKPLNPDSISQEIRNNGFRSIETAAIKSACLPQSFGIPVRIGGKPPANVPLSKDCTAHVTIGKNKMSATIEVKPPFNGGAEVSEKILMDAIAKAGIKTFPDTQKLFKIINEKIYNTPIIIASGQDPVQPEDGRIKWMHDVESQKIEITIDDSGNVDYHKILKINTVDAGEILCEKIGSLPGKDGFNIFQELIPAKPAKTVNLTAGKNCEITIDGNFIKSLVKGQLIIKKDVPQVLPIYEVRGDVDFSTGNIDFNGSVVIHGTVLEGFSVKAEGNIEIQKTLNDAKIEAQGNVILAGGFISKKDGIIKAGGKIGARFIQGGMVYADDEIIVENAIMHANVISGTQIIVKGKKSSIIGGYIFASEYVEAASIGTEKGTKTVIEVGTDILKEQEMIRIDKEISQINEYIKKLMISINVLKDLSYKAPHKFTMAQGKVLEKSQETKKNLEQKIAALDEQKKELYNEIISNQKGKVTATKSFYPGVSIIIKKHFKYDINDTIKSSALGIENDQIKIMPI